MNTCEYFNKTDTNFQRYIKERNKLYERFVPEKQANTGHDPDGKIKEFINKDVIRPISKPEIYEKKVSFTHTNRWALDTTKICTSPSRLPKKQIFKEFNFIKRDKIDVKKKENNYLKTDNISVRVPKEKYNKDKKSFSEAKSI